MLMKTLDFIYHKLGIVYDKSNSFFKTKKKKILGRELNKPILNDLLIGEIKKGNAIGNSSVLVRKNILKELVGLVKIKNGSF